MRQLGLYYTFEFFLFRDDLFRGIGGGVSGEGSLL